MVEIATPVRHFSNATPNSQSKRATRGLYAGKNIIFGNKVSHSERKTRRSWKPNVQRKRLWSETLAKWFRFNLTTHALKCVDKAGGLDSYLLKTDLAPGAEHGSEKGQAVKAQLFQNFESMKIDELEAKLRGLSLNPKKAGEVAKEIHQGKENSDVKTA